MSSIARSSKERAVALRVLALVPYPIGRAPGQRYRIEQWAPLLREEGIDVSFSPFLSPRCMDVLYRRGHSVLKVLEIVRGYVKRAGDVVKLRSADVVFVYREAGLLGPPWIEQLLSWRLPLVFDFDDAIYLADTSPANAWSRALKVRGKPKVICRIARHVTVGNEFLAEFASRYTPAVTVVPSTIDTGLYRIRKRPENDRPVVGWTGSGTTLPYLEALGPALRRLRQRRDFELRVIGGQVQIDGVAVRCVPWNAETEVDDLRPLDVGVLPLPDTEWARGKCGMKALQYMALGVPPVVSPIGANTTIVRDGVNGFHARTDEEWADRLSILLDNAALRSRMSFWARRTVEESYSSEMHASRMARILHEAAS
jgi:glycosyltransferase involved in cell wall biosynthesis